MNIFPYFASHPVLFLQEGKTESSQDFSQRVSPGRLLQVVPDKDSNRGQLAECTHEVHGSSFKSSSCSGFLEDIQPVTLCCQGQKCRSEPSGRERTPCIFIK